MSSRAEVAAGGNQAKGGSAEGQVGAMEERVWTITDEAVAWEGERPVTMTALMDWALEQSRAKAKEASCGADAPVGFNVALQRNDGSVVVGAFVDWAVKSEDGRAQCVAKIGEWVREHAPRYMAVYCDMKGGRADDVGSKMAVIGASEEAAWERIYDMRRAMAEGSIVPERDGPADGIWVDAFQQALHGSKRLAG